MQRLEPLTTVLEKPELVLEHLSSHRPALLDATLVSTARELWAGSWAGLCAAASPWTISVQPNYRDRRFDALRCYMRTRNETILRDFAELPSSSMFIEDYVQQMRARPDETDPAVELRPSTSLLDRLGSPGDVLAALNLSRYHPGKTDAPDAIVVYAYLAGARHASDLHFDRDGRHVFNIQLIGRKRFILFTPRSGPLLNPIMQFGGIRVREWNESQRRDFIAYAGGCEVVLEPGQALYIPPFYWHHVDYLDTAAGLGFRVRPPDPELQRVLARIPANYLLQTVVAELLRRDDPIAQHCRVKLEDFANTRTRSVYQDYGAAQNLLHTCLEALEVEIRGGGSPIVDSLDFGAQMFTRFMSPYLDSVRAPSLTLAPGLRFEAMDEQHVALLHEHRSVPVPLALARALLGHGRGFELDELIADHPEVEPERWIQAVNRLCEIGFIISN